MEANRPASAVIVRVPVPAAIERIRRTWDLATSLGVPSHVTILYPFLAPDDLDGRVRSQLAAIAASHAPFRVRFDRVDRWPAVVFLPPEPAEPLERLIRDIAGSFPDYPPYDGAFDAIVPHLTIAENAEAPAEAIAADAARALPFEHAVTSLEVLVETTDGHWRGHWRIALGRRR